MLKLVLPKGSLEKATMELFADANLKVNRLSSVAYKASIEDPRISEVRILRPQEIPVYVADGLFDIGITGRDWVLETNSEVHSLGQLTYSKATNKPIQVVLAVAGDSPYESARDLPSGTRVSTEYPEITRRYFESLGIEVRIALSYGATEAKIPDIVDAVVDITETGSALKAAGLRVIDILVTSYTELIANPASVKCDEKLHAMKQIHTLLLGVLTAREKVLVKINVPASAFESVINILPAMKTPTVNQLFQRDEKDEISYAVEAVVPRRDINLLVPELHDLGATDILEMSLSKVIP